MAVEKEASIWGNMTSGYRLSLVCGAISCFLTLLVNVAVTLWADTLPRVDGIGSGRRVLYEGSCNTSKAINTGLHVIVNLLSTILVGASNYGIQCLSAPTRRQVDEAHAAGSYLDIGIVSFLNLSRQTGLIRVLWLALLLSSLPLHLLYNSVVFSSLAVPRNYVVALVDERIQHTSHLDVLDSLWDSPDRSVTTTYDNWARLRDLLADSKRPGALENLTALECINEYAVSFQMSRDDVILVHESLKDGQAIEPSVVMIDEAEPYTGKTEPYRWICPNLEVSEPCQPRLDTVREDADDWRPYEYRVKYCLSKPFARQLCRVSFHIHLALGIVLCNFTKMIILAYLALGQTPDRLVVLGDAVQSFIACPDMLTRPSCLVSMQHIPTWYLAGWKIWNMPRVMRHLHKRWITPVGKTRVIIGVVLYIIALIVSLTLLIWGTISTGLPLDLGSIWSLGFGQPHKQTLTSWEGERNFNLDIAGMATVANLAQVILSIICLQWNAILTSMAMGKEWNDYGLRRVGLRVSDQPQGSQGSRRFLELPYQLSLPLIATSALLHWILSQCIFVVAVDWVQYAPEGRYIPTSSVTCGYSPLAMLIFVISSLAIPLSVYLVGRRRLPGPMPVAGSCSLVIAAACHHPDGEGHPDTAVDALQWGVINWEREQQQPGLEERGREQEQGEQRQGLLHPTSTHEHCGFSNAAVGEPQEGQMYA